MMKPQCCGNGKQATGVSFDGKGNENDRTARETNTTDRTTVRETNTRVRETKTPKGTGGWSKIEATGCKVVQEGTVKPQRGSMIRLDQVKCKEGEGEKSEKRKRGVGGVKFQRGGND